MLCRTVAGTSVGDSGGLASGAGDVEVRLHADGTVTHSGLMTCDSAWSCPYCAPSIADVRAREVEAAVRAAQAAGMIVLFVTMTLSHRRGETLEEVFGAVRKVWRSVWGGRSAVEWRRARGEVGKIRTLEVTCGQRNGWHPHVHAVLIFDPPAGVTPESLCSEVRGWLGQRWHAAAARIGRDVELGTRVDRRGVERGVGVDVQLASDPEEVGAYLTKWGVAEEISAAWGKSGGRDGRWSPLGLLAEAEARGGWAKHRWIEYENATAGKQSIRWSPKLRALLAALPTTSAADALTLGLVVSDSEAAQDRSLSPVEASMFVAGKVWNRLVHRGRQHEPGEALRSAHLAREFDHLRAFMLAWSSP